MMNFINEGKLCVVKRRSQSSLRFIKFLRATRGANEPGWFANCSSSVRSKLDSIELGWSSGSAQDIHEPSRASLGGGMGSKMSARSRMLARRNQQAIANSSVLNTEAPGDSNVVGTSTANADSFRMASTKALINLAEVGTSATNVEGSFTITQGVPHAEIMEENIP